MANPLKRAAAGYDPYEEYPQDNPSLWSRLGNTALSGVGAIGNFIDTPFSMVRDVLGGENPLDNVLHPFSSVNRLSGRDLNRKWGLAGKEDTYANWFGGLATEIGAGFALPGLGGLLTGAKAAGNVGRGLTTAAAVAPAAKGLLRFAAPGLGAAEVFTGPSAKAFASGLGTAAEAVSRPSVLARLLDEGVKRAASWVPWKRGAEILNATGDAAQAAAHNPPDFVRFVMPAAEQITEGKSLDDFFKTLTTSDLHVNDQHLDDWLAKGLNTHSQYKAAKDTSNAFKAEIAKRRHYADTVKDTGLTTYHAPESTRDLSTFHAPHSDPSKIYTQAVPEEAADAFAAARKAATSPASDWANTAADILTTPARTMKGLFQAAPFTAFSEFGQKLGEKMQATYPTAVRTARNTVAPWADDLAEIRKSWDESFGEDVLKTLPKEMAKRSGAAEHHLHNQFESFVNHAAEVDPTDAFKQLNLDAGKAKPAMTAKLNNLLDAMKSTGRQTYDDVRDMGMLGSTIEKIEGAGEGVTGFDYFPRAAEYAFDGIGQFLRGFTTRSPHSLARHEGARHVPKLILEKIAHDDLARGPNAAQHILDKYGSYLNKETTERLLNADEVLPAGSKVRLDVGTGKSYVTESKWGEPINHAASLADWAKGREPYQVYLNDTLKVQGRYHNALEITRSNAEAIHNLALEHAGPMGIAPEVTGLPEGAVQLTGLRDFTQPTRGQNILGLPQMYAKAGMDVEKSLKYAAKKLGVKQSQIDSPEIWKQVRKQFDNVGVPEDIANAIEAARKVPSNPEWLSHIGQLLDIPTSWFKQNVTLPFASFAVRNLSSGQYMNAASGEITSLADLMDYCSRVKQAFGDWKSGKITPEMEREWFTNGVLSGDVHFEGVQFRNPEFGKVIPDDPLQGRKSWQEAGEELAPSELDRVPGLRTARQAHGTVLTTGAKANGLVEFLNRVPMYEYLKSKGMAPADAAKRVLELQVDYSPHAFAPFENEVMRRVMPFYCVPDDTTILTRDGWKTCDDVQVGEEVLTYNRDTERTEWQPCKAVNVFDFDGELMALENSDMKVRCTEDHRWVIQKPRLDRSFQPPVMLESHRIRKGQKLIVTAELTAAEDSLISPDDARLLGWAVTDAHSRYRGAHHELVLCQHPNKFLEEVIEVAGSPPRPSAHPNGTVYVTVASDRKQRIEPYLDKSNLIRVVTRLSRVAAEAMCDAMYKADGCVGIRTTDMLACENPGVREAARVLCLLLGKRTGISRSNGKIQGFNISKTTALRTTCLKRTTEHYRGRVWCPTTDNGTWVMKQGDFITITGNSYQRRIAPVILKTLARNPTGVMGQTIRASRLAASDDPTTPSWIGDTLAIPSPFGSKEAGGKAYVTGLGLPYESVAGYFGGGLRGAGRQALSQLNPLLKAPLEWATGQSFFQTGPNGIGRPLDELNPPIGQALANALSVTGRDSSKPVDLPDALEFAAANSPASRLISTARSLTDPRKTLADKALNTLTGIRIADVSPAAADTALAGRVGALLKEAGGRELSETYLPKDRLDSLPPHERELAEQLLQLKKLISQRRKGRKAEFAVK